MNLMLLGGFEARHADGQAIELPGQKDRALLAFLAMSGSVSHSRDRLAALLWGSGSDQQARDSLKHALTRLRQALQDVDPAPINADRTTVRFDSAGMNVDALAFERLVEAGSTGSLEQATSLYRGDLLDGLTVRDATFEEWLSLERQRLRRLAEDAIARLLGQLVAAGSFDRAADCAHRLLALDPLSEPAHCALMRIDCARGQIAQALRRYETLRDRLQKELGVKPSREAAQLYDSIRRGDGAPSVVVEPAARASSDNPQADKPSVAVLPFTNLSGDPDQQYFSDGITEDIITELSRFRSLFVIARQSSFAFKGKPVKVQEIARELGVAYIVEGSVRRLGDRVRINAQLIDAVAGTHLWADKYDRELQDIFAVQDDVARSVVAAVSGRVDVAVRNRVERLSPNGLRAYDLVLHAKSLTALYTRDANAQAIASAERAAELDPTSSRAHVHAAWCRFYDYMARWSPDPLGSLRRALALAERALVLDESDSFAHTMLGIVHWFRREFDQARAEILAGLALNPNDFLSRRYHGLFMVATGEADKGIEQIEIGRRLNPFDTRWVPWNMGIACFSARRYDDAIVSLKQAKNPINEVRGWLAASYAMAGRVQEARATLDEFLKAGETDMAEFPGRRLRDWEPYWHGAFEYQHQRDFDHLFAALRRAGMSD